MRVVRKRVGGRRGGGAGTGGDRDFGAFRARRKQLDAGRRLSPSPRMTFANFSLAKAAIAAGIKLLMQRRGAKELTRLYLAGAFGNYIDRASAQRIGLIDFPPERVEAAGNTALLGAKLALFSLDSEDGSYAGLRRRIEHVALNADPKFPGRFCRGIGISTRQDRHLTN